MSLFKHLSVAALSDIGKKRTNNEDAFGTFPEAGIFCVADGMGGGDDGEIASAAVIRAVDGVATRVQSAMSDTSACTAKDVGDAVSCGLSEASAWICNRTRVRKLNGCGSTFVGVVFDATNPANALAVHAGDSRLYLLRGRSIRQITRDHSVAEMMGEKDESRLNPMFRSMVVNGVGIRPKVEPEFTPFKVEPHDRVLICSDGLTRMVPDKKLSALSREAATPKEAVGKMIAAALEAGGIDNVTAIVIEVGEFPEPVAAVEMPPMPEPAADDLETVNGTSSGGDTTQTGNTLTSATLTAGIVDGESFDETSNDVCAPQPPPSEPPPSPAAESNGAEPPHRRNGRMIAVIGILAGLLVVIAVAFLMGRTKKTADVVSEPAPEVREVPSVAPTSEPVRVAASSPAKPSLAPTSEPVRVTVPLPKPNPPPPHKLAPAVATSVPERVAAPVRAAAPIQSPTAPAATSADEDKIRRDFAQACGDAFVRQFCKRLRKLLPKDKVNDYEFYKEVDQFKNSAQAFSHQIGRRTAAAAAVDLRVLLLTSEGAHAVLAARKDKEDVAGILSAWDDILEGDPAMPSAQVAATYLITNLANLSTKSNH